MQLRTSFDESLGGALAVGMAAVVALTVATSARQAQSVWDRIYTLEQAKRGELVYRDACESCHAPDLSGGKVVPGLVGEAFTGHWYGRTVGQLFEQVLVSMPEENPSDVSRREKVDILAFILRANAFPAGDRELPDRIEVLDHFLFDTRKP